MASPYRVSEETLGMSSMQRGLPGMVSKVAPGPNMFDGTPTTNPMGGGEHQLQSNQRLKLQEMSRNIESAAPQAAAGAVQDMNKMNLAGANNDAEAQRFATTRMAEVLYANQSGNKIMAMDAESGGPERAKFLNGLATGKATAAGMNPDLGAQAAERAYYA